MTSESQNLHYEAPAQEFEEQEEDALSLCDLPLHNHSEEEENSAFISEPEDLFEFATDPIHGYFPMEIVFCGKSIIRSSRSKTITVPQINNNNPFISRSESFKLGHSPSRSHTMQEPKSTASLKSKSNNSRSTQLIGLVKYHQHEMDLNEIRERQRRRAPALMFPATGGEKTEKSEGKGQSGGVVRSLRCRSNLLSALAKASLGCIPHV